MSRIALHGTSKVSALNIINFGYKPIQTNWKVSNRNVCYGVDYGELLENQKYWGFQQSFLQGITSCLVQNVEVLPTVLIIDLNNKSYEEDVTKTFDPQFKPIQISNVTKDDILGCYTLDGNLDAFKVLLYKSLFDRTNVKWEIPSDVREVCECLESVKFKKDSIRRKTIEIKQYSEIDIPNYITI